MSHALRFTTEYVDREDRVRITHHLANGSVECTWLTQRLLNYLLPHLVSWLEQTVKSIPRADVLQAFAQEVAASKLTAQAPVLPVDAKKIWLVDSVDLKTTSEGISLTFKANGDAQSLVVTMGAEPLRQWLSILKGQYTKAQWPLSAWPEWLSEPARPAQHQANMLH